MSEMPTRVQIGPLSYTVTQSADAIRLKERETGHGHISGAHTYRSGEIVVAPGLSSGVLRDTLFHEVLHGVDITFGVMRLSAEDEEAIVDRLSTALLDTLRRNPALVAYLMTEDSGE